MKKIIYILAFFLLPVAALSQATEIKIEQEKKTNTKAVRIYPNPSNGQFTIVFSNYNSNSNIVVLDNVGNKVYANTSLQVNPMRIDLGHLEPGVYFARFIIGNDRYTEKIVILNR